MCVLVARWMLNTCLNQTIIVQMSFTYILSYFYCLVPTNCPNTRADKGIYF
jgi:hypothetical protein